MVFAAGVCTEGPGAVAGLELKEQMRSHNDIEKDSTKYHKKAMKFYDSLAKRAAESGHVIDIFAGCLDQVGLFEMKSLVNNTNGFMILSDSFQTEIFKQSYQRLFSKDEQGELAMGFNATTEVLTTKELKVSGCIGPVVSAGKKTANVGETEIGISGTVAWKFCGVSPKTTIAIYFEVAPTPIQPGTRAVVQFVTAYQHSNRQWRVKVTTIARSWVDSGSPEIPLSFDQEASTVLMARIAAFKSDFDEGPDVLRWLDRMLIRLVP